MAARTGAQRCAPWTFLRAGSVAGKVGGSGANGFGDFLPKHNFVGTKLDALQRARRAAARDGFGQKSLRVVAPALSSLHNPATLERPGHAVRGVPARRDQGPLDLGLSPSRPCARDIRTSMCSTGQREPPAISF